MTLVAALARGFSHDFQRIGAVGFGRMGVQHAVKIVLRHELPLRCNPRSSALLRKFAQRGYVLIRAIREEQRNAVSVRLVTCTVSWSPCVSVRSWRFGSTATMARVLTSSQPRRNSPAGGRPVRMRPFEFGCGIANRRGGARNMPGPRTAVHLDALQDLRLKRGGPSLSAL
jgi:hypothetical protein